MSGGTGQQGVTPDRRLHFPIGRLGHIRVVHCDQHIANLHQVPVIQKGMQGESMGRGQRGQAAVTAGSHPNAAASGEAGSAATTDA